MAYSYRCFVKTDTLFRPMSYIEHFPISTSALYWLILYFDHCPILTNSLFRPLPYIDQFPTGSLFRPMLYFDKCPIMTSSLFRPMPFTDEFPFTTNFLFRLIPYIDRFPIPTSVLYWSNSLFRPIPYSYTSKLHDHVLSSWNKCHKKYNMSNLLIHRETSISFSQQLTAFIVTPCNRRIIWSINAKFKTCTVALFSMFNKINILLSDRCHSDICIY